MLSKNIEEQCLREGGSGREKQMEETGVVTASLQDFGEGTVPFCAGSRAGSCWGACSQEPPCRTDKVPGERAPFLYEPLGRSRPSSKFCRLEVTLQAKLHAKWGTRGAAAPGELPGSIPTRTAGFEASGRFCCLAGLKHMARCTHAGQPGV